jgi:hypothetical protein
MAKPPKIDGDLSDWPCDGWVAVSASNAAYVKTGSEPLSAEIAVRWDKGYVYVAARITDPSVGGNDAIDPYKNDSVEVYVTGDATPTGDYDAISHQFVVDWKGLVADYGPSHGGLPADKNPPHLKAATGTTPGGWTFEASIGQQAFAFGPLASGSQLGLDVEINDGDGTGQVGALIPALAPALSTCACLQQCCCGKSPDLPYCDSARILRTTLQ